MAIVETFQVDFVQIKPGSEIIEDLRSAIAVGNEPGDKSGGFGFLEYCDGPFACDQRLVVGADQNFRALGRASRTSAAGEPAMAEIPHWDRAAPGTSPNSGNSRSADRIRACRSCKQGRRDKRGRMASSRWDRTACRRYIPREHTAYLRDCKRTLQTPACPSGIGQQWPQEKQRTRLLVDVFRKVTDQLRGLSGQGCRAEWALRSLVIILDPLASSVDLRTRGNEHHLYVPRFFGDRWKEKLINCALLIGRQSAFRRW